MEQLRPCAATTEPVLWSPRSSAREATEMRNPRTATRESSGVATKTQCSLPPSPPKKKRICMLLCLATQSCPTLCDPTDYSLPGSSVHGNSPGKNTGVGCHGLLLGIFPTQGSNRGILHCSQILYQLSHKGIPCVCYVIFGQRNLLLSALRHNNSSLDHSE